MRIIDADELLKFIEDRYEITWEADTYEGGIKDACCDIIEKINNMSTIMYQGHWKVYDVDDSEEETPIAWECPNCGEVVDTKWDFCPICGMDMRESK